MACWRSSIPAPFAADVRIMGADSRNDPFINSLISISTRSSHSSSSAKSHFVRAIIPREIPNNLRIFKCSMVWGMIPSSAATTNNAKWMVDTPATIFRMKRSWPGTSIMVISLLINAKPRSMVIPRAFSSSRRSVSVPVSAFTRAVLPWSI